MHSLLELWSLLTGGPYELTGCQSSLEPIQLFTPARTHTSHEAFGSLVCRLL